MSSLYINVKFYKMELIEYLAQKPLLLRYDILAFVITYGVFAPLSYLYLNVEFLYLKFFYVLVLFFNCIYFLMTETKAELKAKNRFNVVRVIQDASYVKFTKKSPAKKDVVDVIKLEKVFITLKNGKKREITYFYRHKIKFYFDDSEKKFRKVKPFIKQAIAGLIKNSNENVFLTEIEELLMDKNILSFPLPNFKQLYKEQLMDPLNFFQLFSVALWFFDDNIYHPLMMLVLLLITNLTVCIQRMNTILNLRSLQTSPYKVQVFDKATNNYVTKSSEELMPGDVIIVQRSALLQKNESYEKDRNHIEELRQQIPMGYAIPEHIFQKMLNKDKQEVSQSIVNSSDLLILKGSVAVDESILTGENLPQIKDSIPEKLHTEIFDKKKFKNNILYAGTDVVQTMADAKEGRVVALVLNTGFTTTKGKLARTVLFNEQNAQESQKEAYVLLFLLLLVSIVASVYVLLKGLEDESRNKDKLFIRCILIVTSVVPPELPMIMAMAVNNSLLYLKKKRMFCTEPFRIPLAGKVEVCVFDKTGTLTQESLVLKGFALYDYKTNSVNLETNIKNDQMLHFDKVNAVLGGCHSLVDTKDGLAGDPIEMLYFNNSDYRYNFSAKTTYYQKDAKKSLQIKRVNYFNSELKRMSAVVKTSNYAIEDGHHLVVKGAPEALEKLFKSAPANYEKFYNDYANQGYRLLSLAIRKLSVEESNEEDRFNLENNLEFIGFLVLSNNLKKDTKMYIKHISESKRDIVILTGDHLLTSIQTYKALEINKKPCVIAKYESDKMKVFDHDGKEVNDYNRDAYNLCISGEDFKYLINHNNELIQDLRVIARVNPKQKELYIEKIKQIKRVLMCGDGTNDVGALKCADVGVALVGTKDEPTQELKAERKKKKQEAIQKALKERRMLKPSEINFDNEDVEFKLGDASIAAPFTNKHSNSIKCVETILKQGVCTLTCGIQSYRIVTLSSFLTAYSLSSLHLENLKFSDMQNTMIGVYGAYLYFTLSNGKPVHKLPEDKPQTSIFNRYFWLSLFGQLVLQFAGMFALTNFAKKYAPADQHEVDNEEEFVPTFINSVMFLFDLSSMFCISIFNYEGRPFMMSLSENKKHFKFLILPLFVLLILIFDLSDMITTLFQTTYKSTNPDSETFLFAIVFGFIGLSYAWTTFVKYLKLGRIDKWI